MAEHVFDLTLNPDIALRITALLREYDADPELLEEEDSGDGAFEIDEAVIESIDRGGLGEDDPVLQEIETLVVDLNIDAQRDLLALIWVGRGDYAVERWSDARRQAREVHHLHLARYLAETPLASDYIEAALDQLGYDTEDSRLT